jgi:hypothetical protein
VSKHTLSCLPNLEVVKELILLSHCVCLIFHTISIRYFEGTVKKKKNALGGVEYIKLAKIEAKRNPSKGMIIYRVS